MAKLHYVRFSNGLRGCYLYDSSYVDCIEDKDELRGVLLGQAYDINQSYWDSEEESELRFSEEDVESLWQHILAAKSSFPICYHATNNESYGYFIESATLEEYKQYKEEEN